ncbi:MAG: tetratricopeptide repeat protein [Opitutus sp.]
MNIPNHAMSAAGSRRRSLVYGAGLAAAIVMVYWNSLTAPFLFDDLGAVTLNPTIRDLWSLQTLQPPSDGSTTTGRPLLNLSYAINYAIGGESVVGYHVVNVMIHVLAALVLLGIVRRTLARSTSNGVARFSESQASGLAVGVAALWALHPLQTETVTCIAQRSESLCSLFYLGTLYAFIRGTAGEIGKVEPSRKNSLADESGSSQPRRRGWLAGSVLLCLGGMACKEVMVTAPLAVLLYDRTFVAGSFGTAWRRRRRFYFFLAGTWALLGWLVISGAGARGASAGVGLGVSSWEYLLTQARAIVLYLKLAVWPYPLVLDYGTGVDRSLADVAGQAMIVLALLVGVIWALVRRPTWGFIGAFFFLLLAPSSSVVPLVTQTIAEHRMYLPLASVIVLVVTGAARLGRGKALLFPFALLVLLCAAFTIARNRDYADALIIWTDTAEKFPSSARAHNNLALELDRRGRSAEALQEFARAVSLDARYVSAYFNWGTALLRQGQPQAAVEPLRAAVRLAPNHADAQLALGNALVSLGASAEAVEHYEAALATGPGADVHYNLGVALAALERDDAAAAQFRTALELQPTLADAHYQLGRIAERRGWPADAAKEFEATLQLSPEHAGAHRRLGLLAARASDFETAGGHFEAVVRLQPRDADALANLGNTFLARGNAQRAATLYEDVLRLRPDDRATQENLRLAREALTTPR